MEQETALWAEQKLSWHFRTPELLTAALTHTSFVKGDGHAGGGEHNERLEFLGDAVLELIVSDRLYGKHPDRQEGWMTRARARLVCEDALFNAASALGLPAMLRLGRGEERTGGREKPSVVSDALEAVIGAIYLDGGMEPAKEFVLQKIILPMETELNAEEDRDYKTRLHELVTKRRQSDAVYELMEELGPEHRRVFRMRVLLDGAVYGQGEGSSKQAASQQAAKNALIKLGETL